jgi:hypothetical protein
MAQPGRPGRARGSRVIEVKQPTFRQSGDSAINRSTKSPAVADLSIAARDGRLRHSATAKQYCPSSSTGARHSTPGHAAAAKGARLCAVVRSRTTCRCVGGEILVKRRSGSETDQGNVAAKCDDQARQEQLRMRIARASCHRASGGHDTRCNSPRIPSACAPLRARSTAFQKNTRSRYSRRIVPISRSTNGCETGAYGTDLISSTSSTRRLASQR